MSDAAQSLNTTDRYAEFVLDGMRFALPVSVVLDLGQLKGLVCVKTPGAPGCVDRVINHRGRVVPVIDLRMLCGFAPLAAEIQEMEDLLKAREEDHVNWLNALAAAVEDGSDFTLGRDPDACKFGKWYDGVMGCDETRSALTNGDVALESLLREFDQPHKRIHALADEVLDLATKGERARAKGMVREAWEGDLAVMRRLFERTMVLFREVRQPQLVVIEVDGIATGLMVDEILSVGEYGADVIHPAPPEARTEAPVVGLAEARGSDEMVTFLDARGIIDAVGMNDASELAA